MNKQKKFNPDGSIKSKGIDWTDFTFNPVGGGNQRCALCGKMSNGVSEQVIHDPACAYLPIERALAKVDELLPKREESTR